MPALGDQHRPNAASANPFEGRDSRICEYSAREIATLQSRLDKQLGPEYVSSRPGAGGSKVHYLAAEKVINLANEVFGFNGWSSQIQNIQIDFCDENPNTGKISIGLSVITRVTLKDGTFHEDIGYGQIENCKGKAAAFEKAKKEGATDALKRALRTFGNVLGNCLYDKDYLAKITKIKPAPSRWDPDNLHRPTDHLRGPRPDVTGSDAKAAPEAPERGDGAAAAEIDDDFGVNLFDEVDLGAARPDEVVLPPGSRPHTPRPPPGQRLESRDGKPDMPRPATETLGNHRHSAAAAEQRTGPQRPDQDPTHQPQGQRRPVQSINPPMGFITSRAAELLQDEQPPDPSILNSLPRFDPLADSPSIRKTSGVNHATSAPVARSALGAAAANAPHPPNPMAHGAQARAPPAVAVNPVDGIQRRIGAPGGGMSPMANRGAYKPPTMAGVKRPATPLVDAGGPARAPFADVSNTAGQGAGGAGEEAAKRQKAGEA